MGPPFSTALLSSDESLLIDPTDIIVSPCYVGTCDLISEIIDVLDQFVKDHVQIKYSSPL